MDLTEFSPRGTHSVERVDHTWTRRVLGTGAAAVPVSAMAGAVGLATGALPLTPEIDARLPLRSPVLGGAALALIVGMPFGVVAWQTFRRDRRAPATTFAAGVLLLGWILIEMLIVREFSPLQPAFFAIGAAFTAVGWMELGGEQR